MSIDAYSLCPGGTGKKIKFCCNDLLPELQKIDRMIEGEQYTACLQYIDRLMEMEPNRDRACLLAMKCTALRSTDRHEDLANTVADFLAKHPDNQIALAESAFQSVQGDVRAAFASLLRAMRVAGGRIELQTYQAMGMAAAFLHHRGFPLPARALVLLMCEISSKDHRAQEMLLAFSQAQAVPLLLRDDQPAVPASDDAPWKTRFHEAREPYSRGDWLTAVERFEALAADVPDSSVVWRNLATFRGWLADNPGCIEALRRHSALRAEEENGLEDAAEAEATAMFLTDDPLGDQKEMLKAVWTVKDAERAQEAFLSSPRWQAIPFDPAQLSSADAPPPKGAFVLRDRPKPASAEGLSLETVPRLLGQALLFGRQTDREARLEVMGVAADELPAVAAMIADTAGDAVEPEPKRETIGNVSASRRLLRAPWDPPNDATSDQLDAMMVQYVREAVLDRWPDLKLGVLDGRSPRQAADDPACRARLLGAIMVLEHWAEQMPGEIDFNELRTRLGLPTLDPIDPQKLPVEKISAVRLARMMVEPLSDDDLLEVFHHAQEFAVRPALRKFARAIIDRPSLAESKDREDAFVTMAQTEEDFDRAIEYVDRGRRAAEAAGKSDVMWDLMELSFNFARRNGREAARLIEHIQRKHGEEPGVGEALTRIMIDVGLLRPDGTPAMDPDAMEPAMAAANASPESEPAELWTPDSDQPGGGGGKLWTPGQE